MASTVVRGWLAALLFGFALSGTAAEAQTQPSAWPDRGVKFILPFGPGSGTDIAARLLSERLTATWNKPIIVENRPGADGLLAIQAFISANDDHVLLYASSASFIAHPYTQEKLPYVLERDLEPIARVSETILTVSVPAESNIKTVAEFVARARAEPQKYNAAGAAGLPEFAVMAFLKSENLGATKLPYRDIMQAGRDLGESRIQFLLSSYAAVRPLVEAGKVKVIAVGGKERNSVIRGVPTVIEAGYPGLNMETTSAFYGPKGMPLALRQKIAADVIAAASDPSIAAKIVASGQLMRAQGPAELAAALKEQADTAARIAKIIGMERKN